MASSEECEAGIGSGAEKTNRNPPELPIAPVPVGVTSRADCPR
jgi:hypothetical protein